MPNGGIEDQNRREKARSFNKESQILVFLLSLLAPLLLLGLLGLLLLLLLGQSFAFGSLCDRTSQTLLAHLVAFLGVPALSVGPRTHCLVASGTRGKVLVSAQITSDKVARLAGPPDRVFLMV